MNDIVWCVNGIWEWGEEGESFDLFSTYAKAKLYAIEEAKKNRLEDLGEDCWSSKKDHSRDVIYISEIEVK